ncbi:2'-5' RNA ligase [Geodermatophilus dictyosporus]|uniref:RNA 2',3'-cyclic phosphodiesterase n=1 Tax=Geodermatophilus dictyosporus TaxID=1523247 RepID=A0A1I5NGN0_9ACTN|nr:RNA 2',3'-cyclic phosphodiesterase [Geodermatophilus dictyosporus]SFP20371.1 2'-5' RNA ligase [Geodermatophilus dictyosporus]
MSVEPPGAARADLAAALAPLRDAPGAPRWGDPARWHLTLLFLGAVPPGLLPDLTAAVGEAVARTPPAVLRLAGAGRFGSRRRPQVCWAGLDGDVAVLTALAGRLAAAARALGLPVEDRPFRAHLTLGRWLPRRPADGDLPDRLAGYRGPPWPLREVSLVRSSAGRHEPLTVWSLTG